MNSKFIPIITISMFVLLLTPVVVLSGPAQDYEALKGVVQANTIFDFREGAPGGALVHLSLIHETYKDRTIQNLEGKSQFVVVFMGRSVNLVSSDTEGFTEEETETIEKIHKVITAMAKDGIKLEICRFAADFFDVKAESILPEIDQVANGWISSIGYQAQGYALVPIF